MNVLDFVILAFLAWNIFWGWKRGLLSQILGLAGVVVSLFVASRFGKVFGQWLAGFIDFEGFATKMVTSEAESQGLSSIVADKLQGTVPDIVAALQNILGYVILFIVVLVAVKLLAIALKSLKRVPVLGAFNSVGGLIFGLIKGALITLVAVWVFNSLPIPAAMGLVESSLLAPGLLKITPEIFERIFNPHQYKAVVETIREVLKLE